MRFWLICTLFILIGLLFCSPVQTIHAAPTPAPVVDPLVESQANQLQLDPVEKYWAELTKDYGSYFTDNQPPSFMELLVPKGKGLHPSNILKGLFQFFFREVLMNGKLLATIVILTVFSMILETLQSSFEKSSVNKVAYAVSYMVLIVLAMNSLNTALGYAKDAISGMIHFMLAIVPLLLTLLASMGNLTSAAIFHPLIVFMIHTIGTAIYLVVFPLLFLSTLLHVISSISERYKVTQLANLMRSIAVGLLGFFVTVFLGVMSVQGATGAVTDGVTIRTAKYVTGNFVPVVGRMFSDASETVVGASLLVKNAVGITGVVILVLLCAFPAVKILVLALIFKVSAAILQPMGDSPIIQCLQIIGKNMIYVFAALAAVGFMFFLAITIIITAGNVSVMMR
ncbi:stage III sporulation protein AE [Paenibacillus psychroresistens]|uniref:Stage III sporulation protein AE n=1 Tax=Paenibacillus psychroresistens TaxID=1778678 RepID=A0A6B8RL40_9BACL|nr:stage III sporulation protein AE [Paenibacillus psychroresistens]QGQ97111.1 stage III sporulation protein AE [Paenibacillus psychroresistens]